MGRVEDEVGKEDGVASFVDEETAWKGVLDWSFGDGMGGWRKDGHIVAEGRGELQKGVGGGRIRGDSSGSKVRVGGFARWGGIG